MKAISFIATFVLAVSSFGQSGVMAQGSVIQNNFGLYWQCRLEPPAPPLDSSLTYASGYENASVYRLMIDRAQRIYFGYQVRIEPLPQKMYRLNFQSLHLNPETMKRLLIDDPGWKKLEFGTPAGRPLYPFRDAPDTVAELDVVAVNLMMNPDSGQKIVDYFVLQGASASWSWSQLSVIPEFSYPTGEPRDFGVEDASLRLVQPRLKINGKSEDIATVGDASSPIYWLYVPDRGRYILSLAAHAEAGFRKAGEVRGSSLNFTVGSDRYSISSTKPITAADAAFNLYVLLDSGWKPTYPNAATSSIMMGVADQELMSFLNRMGFRKARQ